MLTLIAVVQIALPLVLIGWLAVWPAGSWAGLATQALGTGLVLYALWRVALWGVPPRWAMAVLAALWAVALAGALWRLSSGGATTWPSGWGWAGAVAGAALAALGGAVSFQALAAARPPDGAAPVPLSAPLGPGRYLVAHGGGGALLNVHVRTLAPEPRFSDWRGQSYGIDVLGLTPAGLSRPLLPVPDPAAYPIFGADVLAPCAGRVVAAVDGLPDMPAPRMDTDRKLGNHVIVACEGAWIVMAHLRQGSVRVAPGDSVSTGQVLGQVGNSGNSSEPHLHLHAQRPGAADAPLAADPLPLRIEGRFPTRNDVLTLR